MKSLNLIDFVLDPNHDGLRRAFTSELARICREEPWPVTYKIIKLVFDKPEMDDAYLFHCTLKKNGEYITHEVFLFNKSNVADKLAVKAFMADIAKDN